MIVRCSDDSGKLILTEVKDGPLLQVILISLMMLSLVCFMVINHRLR